MKNVLLISFTSIDTDQRVRRQVRVLSSTCRVTYIGIDCNRELLGENVDFYPIKRLRTSKFFNFHFGYPQLLKKPISLFLRIILFFRELSVYLKPSLRYWSIDMLRVYFKVKRKNIDVIFTNDLLSLPYANKFKKAFNCKMIFDAHEYYLDEHQNDKDWVRLHEKPSKYIAERFFSQADIFITICKGIADLYEKEYGIKNIELITNASEYAHLVPSTLIKGEKIKLVHHGFYKENRNIESIVDMMNYLPRDKYELHLYLLGNSSKFIHGMIEKFDNIFDEDIVPSVEIPKTMNQYDIGIMAFKPTTENLRYVLPNKFFEFIQSRVVTLSGPSVEVKRFVDQFEIGRIAEGFEAKELADAVLKLGVEEINKLKSNVHESAEILSSTENERKLIELIERAL